MTQDAASRAAGTRTREEVANDPMLIELARKYKRTPELLAELAKYKPTIPSIELLFTVLP